MFSKFSVKKPYTVFVGVIAILVLGVVSFLKLTPDLFPNIDFPYVIITTTYAGASPEEVENTVTRPIEQSMARLDNINSISSTSAENYSMVMLEFTDGTDLATVSIDISNAINQLESGWDEMVGTPIILKINPNMLATAVVAVSMEDYEEHELTEFVNETLLTQLEGIEGVASVSASGTIEKSVEVRISEEKLGKLNKRIENEIIRQFDEAYGEIEKAEEQLAEGKEAIAAGTLELEKGRGELEKAKAEAEEQLDEAAAQLSAAQRELNNARKELDAAKEELLNQKEALYEAYEQMLLLKTTVATLNQSKLVLESALASLEAVENYVLSGEIDTEDIDKIISEMTGGEYTSLSLLQAGMATIECGIAEIDAFLESTDATLREQGYSLETLDQAISDIEEGIKMIDEYAAEIENGYLQLDEAQKLLNQGKAALAAGEAEAAKQFAEAENAITSGLSQLNASSAQLKTAEEELEAGKEQIDAALDEAIKAADVGIMINLELVATIFYAQHFEMPAGYVLDGEKSVLVRVGDKYDSVENIGEMVLFDMGIEGISAVTLSDVADIVYTDNSDESFASVNGARGVVLSFAKQSNYATAEVSEAIIEKLGELEKKYDGLEFSTLMDQGDYIDIIISSVMENMVIGAILAIIILIIFLRDIKPTFMVALSIPISVVFAIVLMYFSGVTMNIISLAGLAAGIGMLVDNSIVVIENIYRLRSLGLSPVKAAVSGASQVAGAITSSTLTTVCVFLPIVFVEGLTRQLFQDMALTIAYSLLASLVIALTLIPAMSPAVLRNIKESSGKESKTMNGYTKVVEFSLNHKVLVLALAVILLGTSAFACVSRGFIFMPGFESNQLTVNISLPEGSVLDDTSAVCMDFEKEVLEVEGVETVGTMLSGGISSMVGMSMGGNADVTSATAYVLLNEEGEKNADEITEKIAGIAESYSEKAEITVSGGMMDMTSMLTGSGVTINVYGEDLEDITLAAGEISEIIGEVNGISYVSAGEEKTEPTINISVDKEAAMKKGLTVAQIFQEIATKITKSATAATVETENGDYDIIVISEKAEDFTRKDLENYVFEVQKQDGTTEEVKLKDIAEILDGRTLSSISRSGQRRYLSVSAGIAEGENVTIVSSAVQKALADYEAPDGIVYEFSGENETIMEAIWELVKMLLIGVVLVYLIMVAQFQSLRSPFIVMFTIPLAFTGAFLALMLWGLEISVVAMIGLVMLVGIIVNNGIVLVDYINQLREDGKERREAVIEGAKTRLRPIFMTALTTILALVPIALGIGFGSSLIQPVAVCCIGGLLYATIMTLVVIPVMYELLSRKEMRIISKEDLEISDL
ncbi:MAG: efflux RND transporter permease subunit [Oscillospiraceae bacterium]|nr:efflux RND transporter permease subunit [Oscillospiraceae bacterium]